MPEDIEVPVVPVGILEPRQDRFDDLAFVDPGTLREVTGAEEPADAIYVRAGSPEEVFPVAGRIRAMGLSPSGSFEQIDAVNRLMDTVVLFLSFFAGVSLIVGALMITNIMVISVFERTREIGITMALGASSRDIVALVLLEGLSIGILGGILGDLLGMGIAAALNAAGKPLVLSALGDAFPGIAEGSLAIVTPPMLVLGLIVSVALSLLAGIYPALKASRLNPVEAIRQGA
jgi:putative ABC transport system permease protein